MIFGDILPENLSFRGGEINQDEYNKEKKYRDKLIILLKNVLKLFEQEKLFEQDSNEYMYTDIIIKILNDEDAIQERIASRLLGFIFYFCEFILAIENDEEEVYFDANDEEEVEEEKQSKLKEIFEKNKRKLVTVPLIPFIYNKIFGKSKQEDEVKITKTQIITVTIISTLIILSLLWVSGVIRPKKQRGGKYRYNKKASKGRKNRRSKNRHR